MKQIVLTAARQVQRNRKTYTVQYKEVRGLVTSSNQLHLMDQLGFTNPARASTGTMSRTIKRVPMMRNFCLE